MTVGTYLALLGSALAVALAGSGSAIGVGLAGEAAAGVTSESPEHFSKVLVLQLLSSTTAIYGLLIGFLVLVKINLFGEILPLTTESGFFILIGCLPIAIVGFICGIFQGRMGASAIAMVGKRPEESGKGIILTVMLETSQVFALLMSFLAIMIPEFTTII